MSLFKKTDWTMGSGGVAHYKINGEALTDEDFDALAFIVSEKLRTFANREKSAIRTVYGATATGERFAKAFDPYVDSWGSITLIVDDVLTTGTTMENAKMRYGVADALGVVIFARGNVPDWVKPIFTMPWFNTWDEWQQAPLV